MILITPHCLSLGICDCCINIWPSCFCSFFICSGAWVLAQSKYNVQLLLIENTTDSLRTMFDASTIYMQSILPRIIDGMIATMNLTLQHRIIQIWYYSCPKIWIYKFSECDGSVRYWLDNMLWRTSGNWQTIFLGTFYMRYYSPSLYSAAFREEIWNKFPK